MADGVFGANSYVRPYTAYGSPRIVHFEQGSTVSTALFGIGDAVVKDATTASHRVVQHSTGATPNITGLMGFAAEAADASATIGTTKKPIFVVSPEAQFIGVAKGTLAATNTLTGYNLKRDSTLGIMYIDLAVKATGTMCVVDDFVEGSQVGDTNGFVVFHVVDAGRQYFKSTT